MRRCSRPTFGRRGTRALQLMPRVGRRGGASGKPNWSCTTGGGETTRGRSGQQRARERASVASRKRGGCPSVGSRGGFGWADGEWRRTAGGVEDDLARGPWGMRRVQALWVRVRGDVVGLGRPRGRRGAAGVGL
ncbi:hypothetical protein BRADI_3g51392v3 [Brachypodium distachyon]|uniref:Uncharacterized protein n=1 Tax=Brachypodium distachyon TaxID=15368 RepID=A0A0Q3FNG8_BRADI|nr:hypothetical protein BRADI_3g51392v3 [Brachypodium distachyon]